MKFFEDTKQQPVNVVLVMEQLFKEFKELPVRGASRYISPSGLGCAVACACKLHGIVAEPRRENFQTMSFMDAGEDRHKRIQQFLVTTPYWVNVATFIKERNLPLKAVYKVDTKKYSTPENPLPEEILVEEKDDFLLKYQLPEAALFIDDYETLLVHKTLPIRFKCDGILYINGTYYVLEIKTESATKNRGRDLYDPKHQLQGKAYSWLFNIENILWVYESRDTLTQKFFVQLVLKEERKSIEDYIQAIVDCGTNLEKLPKCYEEKCTHSPYTKHYKSYMEGLVKNGKRAVSSTDTDK